MQKRSTADLGRRDGFAPAETRSSISREAESSEPSAEVSRSAALKERRSLRPILDCQPRDSREVRIAGHDGAIRNDHRDGGDHQIDRLHANTAALEFREEPGIFARGREVERPEAERLELQFDQR